MFKQVNDNLFIGNADAVYEHRALAAQGVTGIVRLHEPPPAWPEAPFDVLGYPIPDGHAIPSFVFDDCLDFISEHQRQGGRVAVVCRAGISRSATIVLAHLINQGYSPQQAYQHLIARHPQAEPHPALWISLIRYYNLPVDMLDVLAWGIAAR